MGDDTSRCFIKIGPAGRVAMTSYEIECCEDAMLWDSDYLMQNERIEWDGKGRNRIAQIFIWHGLRGIHSLQFQYADHGIHQSGLVLSKRLGMADGAKFDVVKLDCPSECISWIHGHTNTDVFLCSLTIGTTNGKQYGPFGQMTTDGEEFSFEIGVDNEFGGFFGFYNQRIVTAIGIYLKATSSTV